MSTVRKIPNEYNSKIAEMKRTVENAQLESLTDPDKWHVAKSVLKRKFVSFYPHIGDSIITDNHEKQDSSTTTFPHIRP